MYTAAVSGRNERLLFRNFRGDAFSTFPYAITFNSVLESLFVDKIVLFVCVIFAKGHVVEQSQDALFDRDGRRGPQVSVCFALLAECSLTGLLHRDFSHNSIAVIPSAVTSLLNLEYLDFGENSLSELPSDIMVLTSLRYLSVHSNNIKVLPDELGSLTALTSLQIYYNRISALPGTLKDLTLLSALDLRSNYLSTFPAEMTLMTQLTSLNLAGTSFEDEDPLPSEMTYLTAIEELDLGWCEFYNFPSVLYSLTALRSLQDVHACSTHPFDLLAGTSRAQVSLRCPKRSQSSPIYRC